MMKNHPVAVITAHEITTALKDRYFRLMVLLFLILTAVSAFLGALQVHQKMAEYHASAELLKSLGRMTVPPPPDINILGVSRSFINYVSMIGALIAILTGWNSLRSEKDGKLLALLLSRPVFRDQLILGKFLGTAAVFLFITAASGGLVAVVMVAMPGSTPDDLGRMVACFGGMWLYLLLFGSVAQLITLLVDNTRAALLTAIIIWLLFTFLLPQIGDTMDMDNQIPGGFFSYLGLNRTQEKDLLSNFAWYEYFRNGLEVMSPTKHFERFSFALLNIKPGFSDMTTLQVVGSKFVNLATLLMVSAVSLGTTAVVFVSRKFSGR
jgi:ABC-2 type transport system permease protein